MKTKEHGNIEEIIERCIKRDQQAEEILYRTYFGYALTVALLYIEQYDDALLVVNDSFIKVFRGIKGFKKGSSFKPWLRRIVINSALDWIRAEERRIEIADVDEVVDEDHYSLEEEIEQRDEIVKLLRRVPPLLRRVFLLYEVEGYSHKEIAKAMKISQSSSRVYLARARKELRGLYKIES